MYDWVGRSVIGMQNEILDGQSSALFWNEPFEKRPVMTIEDFVLHSDDHFESHLLGEWAVWCIHMSCIMLPCHVRHEYICLISRLIHMRICLYFQGSFIWEIHEYVRIWKDSFIWDIRIHSYMAMNLAIFESLSIHIWHDSSIWDMILVFGC